MEEAPKNSVDNLDDVLLKEGKGNRDGVGEILKQGIQALLIPGRYFRIVREQANRKVLGAENKVIVYMFPLAVEVAKLTGYSYAVYELYKHIYHLIFD